MSSRALLYLASILAALAALSTAGHASSSALDPGPTLYSPAGKVFMTREEALEMAFPKCEVKRTTQYLSKSQIKAVAKLATVEFESGVVHPYVAMKDGKLIGTAYFDTHRVRTMRQTLMIVVNPDDSIQRVEVLSFAEPREYIPRKAWYAQFPGRKLDKELNLKRKIKTVTGASLTAKATTSSARRILALHNTLARLAKEKAEEARKKNNPPKDEQSTTSRR